MFAGELDRAVDSMHAYMRRDPFYPTSAIGWLGVAYCMLDRLPEALTLLREAVARSSKRAMVQYWLVATYGHLGNVGAAQNQARALLTLQPSFRIRGTARPLAVSGPVRLPIIPSPVSTSADCLRKC
jgi:lipopolysaccharide biosynthesis regulator YciM